MKKIVISQPYFFPWIGLFEQILLSDIFVHYDDVQFSKGHFMNRVQIKTSSGFKWLTVPLKSLDLGDKIDKVKTDESKEWRRKHLEFLAQTYKKAPYVNDMIKIVNDVYQNTDDNLANISIYGLDKVLQYFKFENIPKFYRSSILNIKGKGSKRVLLIVNYFKANIYITGYGALKYFDFDLFENAGVRVEFIHYKKEPYPQLYTQFNPYVSILDLIANVGKEGSKYFLSSTVYWKDFIKKDEAINYLTI